MLRILRPSGLIFLITLTITYFIITFWRVFFPENLAPLLNEVLYYLGGICVAFTWFSLVLIAKKLIQKRWITTILWIFFIWQLISIFLIPHLFFFIPFKILTSQIIGIVGFIGAILFFIAALNMSIDGVSFYIKLLVAAMFFGGIIAVAIPIVSAQLGRPELMAYTDLIHVLKSLVFLMLFFKLYKKEVNSSEKIESFTLN